MTFVSSPKWLVLPLIVGVTFIACDDNDVPPASALKKKAVALVQPTDAGVTASGPQFVYVYNPIGKRDPFRGLGADVIAAQGEQVANESCADPLCQYDLDDLKLVAVVSGDANPVAMLEDRTGTGHIVRRNTNIGRQGGKVSAVLRDCIQVTNYVLGPDGKRQPNRVDLCTAAAEKAEVTLDLMQGKMK